MTQSGFKCSFFALLLKYQSILSLFWEVRSWKDLNLSSFRRFSLVCIMFMVWLHWLFKTRLCYLCSSYKNINDLDPLGIKKPQKQKMEKAVWTEMRSTSAAGIPSGGRHCSNTSCSSRTSRPSGSCSKFFLRSTGRGGHICSQQLVKTALWQQWHSVYLSDTACHIRTHKHTHEHTRQSP